MWDTDFRRSGTKSSKRRSYFKYPETNYIPYIFQFHIYLFIYLFIYFIKTTGLIRSLKQLKMQLHKSIIYKRVQT